MITLYAAMAMQSEFNGRMLEIVRELAGSAMISLPSSVEDFDNPEIAPISSATCARPRWTPGRASRWCACVGLHRHPNSAAAMRNTRNSTAARRSMVKQNVYRNFDFKRASALVDAALALPPVAGD